MFQERRMQQPRCSEFAVGARVHELARWKVLLLLHSTMSCQYAGPQPHLGSSLMLV